MAEVKRTSSPVPDTFQTSGAQNVLWKKRINKICAWTIAAVIICALVMHWMKGCNEKKSQQSTLSVLHPNFVPGQPCPVMKVWSYANKDLSPTHDTLTIKLTEGCYADWYILPGYFDEWETVLSSAPGDYVSLWCNGNPNPYPVLQSTRDTQGLLKREMYRCGAPGQWTSDFHFQGRGTITITATRRRLSKPIGDDGYPAL